MQASQRLQLAMAARRMCAAYLQSDGGPKDRARDVLFLDMALAAHARTIVESNLDALSAHLDDKLSDGSASPHTAALRRPRLLPPRSCTPCARCASSSLLCAQPADRAVAQGCVVLCSMLVHTRSCARRRSHVSRAPPGALSEHILVP